MNTTDCIAILPSVRFQSKYIFQVQTMILHLRQEHKDDAVMTAYDLWAFTALRPTR
jgi:hypothetical protein